MPQKSNPVLPALLGAIARQAAGLDAIVQGARVHRQQRDASAWMTEWMSLPQLCVLTARALSAGDEVARGLALAGTLARAPRLSHGSPP